MSEMGVSETGGNVARPSMAEIIESLTGFDEIAIAGRFGAEFDDLSGLRLSRALVFIEERRAGKPDAAAYETAMSLRVKDITARFVDDGEEEVVLPGDIPETEAGKGVTPDVSEPVTSPRSVS